MLVLEGLGLESPTHQRGWAQKHCFEVDWERPRQVQHRLLVQLDHPMRSGYQQPKNASDHEAVNHVEHSIQVLVDGERTSCGD